MRYTCLYIIIYTSISFEEFREVIHIPPIKYVINAVTYNHLYWFDNLQLKALCAQFICLAGLLRCFFKENRLIWVGLLKELGFFTLWKPNWSCFCIFFPLHDRILDINTYLLSWINIHFAELIFSTTSGLIYTCFDCNTH